MSKKEDFTSDQIGEQRRRAEMEVLRLIEGLASRAHAQLEKAPLAVADLTARAEAIQKLSDSWALIYSPNRGSSK